MYAKIDSSNNIVTYPYDISNLRTENPNISFTPTALSSSDIRSEYKIVEVEAVSLTEKAGKKSVEGSPALDGSVWKQSWSSVNLSAEEKTNVALTKRRGEYGSLEDQIEFITENGLDAWQTKVADIKTKYPKP